MAETLKIVIPMAGWGTRMRPHTWSKPKPLISVAGKAALDHLMDMFDTLPQPANVEYVFIVAPYLGEQHIPAYVAQHYPAVKAHFVIQHEMKGQSHAIYLAREYLRGAMLMCFSDTLIETDFSFLANESGDGVAWVKPVPDPRRFGVAELDAQGRLTRLIEKPQTMANNLAVVGCYYFKSGEALLAAIEEQLRRNVQLRGEYFLTEAINVMIARGALLRTQKIEVWLDMGTVEATLETNRYLLEHGRENAADHLGDDVNVVRPVFIHPSAQVRNSTIGPHVSVGPDCTISDSRIADSILEAGCEIQAAALSRSLVGRQARVQGRGAAGRPMAVNLGDDCSVILE